MNLAVYDISGKQVGSYDIDPAELAPTISKQLLHDAVVIAPPSSRSPFYAERAVGAASPLHSLAFVYGGPLGAVVIVPALLVALALQPLSS